MSRTIQLILISLCISLLATATAHAEVSSEKEWWKTKKPQFWNFSLAPGYSFLLLNGRNKVHQGFGSRLLIAYNITDNWSVGGKGRLGIYDADKNREQGIYSQVSLMGVSRYTFPVAKWFRPYVFLGMGWVRTELNREIYTKLETHSMVLEPGAALSFRIMRKFWLGLETAVAPVFFGDGGLNGSMYYHLLLSLDLRL